MEVMLIIIDREIKHSEKKYSDTEVDTESAVKVDTQSKGR